MWPTRIIVRKMIQTWRLSAGKMQRAVRGHLGRVKAHNKRRVHTTIAMEGQRFWRGYAKRKWYKAESERRANAAT